MIVAGAGNAGLCAAHAARERGARVLVLEKADRGVVGRQLRLHRRRDPLRPRRARRRARASSRHDERLAATDLDPYSAEDFLADMRRVTLGRGDAGDGARAGRRLGATPCAGCAGRGLRFRLMYERQAYEVDGRHRFWGGLAVGTVDGGERADGAAPRGGRARRDRAAPRAPRSRTCCATRTARSRRRGPVRRRRARRAARAARSCSPPAASRPTRSCARPTSARTGTWRRSAARRTTPARCCAPRSRHGAQAYGHWSGCHAIQWDARRAAHRRPRAHQPLLAPVLSGRDRRQRRRRALHRRGRRLPQLHLREVRRRGAAPAAGHRRAGLRRQHRRRCCATIDYEAPGATRVDADTLARARRGAGHRPRAASSARSREFNAAIRPGDVRPDGQGRQAHRGHRRRRSPTGRCRSTRRRSSRFPVTCGITFTFGGVRVDDDARVLDAAGRPLPGPVRGGRAGRRAVLPQLPGRQRADGRRRLRPPRGVDGRHDGVIALRHLHARRPS